MAQGFFNLGPAPKIEPARKVSKFAGCSSCGLDQSGKHEPWYGDGEEGILILGDAPKTEEELGGPFKGKKYELFWEMEGTRQFSKDFIKDFTMGYAIPCPLNGQKLDNQRAQACKGRLLKHLKAKKPRVIIACGPAAIQALVWDRIGGRIGKGTQATDFIGKCIPDRELNAWIIPTYGFDYLSWQYDKDGKLRDKLPLKFFQQHLRKGWLMRNKPFPEIPDKHVETTRDPKRAVEMIREALKQKRVTIDYETTGIKPHRKGHEIKSASVAWRERKGIVAKAFQWFGNIPEFVDAWKELMTSLYVQKCAHKMDFEISWTHERAGLGNSRCDWWPKNWGWDTCLAEHCINNEGKVGLKFITYTELGVIGYDESIDRFICQCPRGEEEKHGKNAFNHLKAGPIPWDDLLYYDALDSAFSHWHWENQEKQLDDFQLTGFRLFMRGIEALAKVHFNGLPFDLKRALEERDNLTQEIDRLWKEIMNAPEVSKWTKGNFNPSSPAQLIELLFDILKIPCPVEKPNVQESTLEKLGLEFVDKILQHRKVLKLRDTFLDGIIKEAVWDEDRQMYLVRPFFNLSSGSESDSGGPRTFRSSSDSPNFQNIPKRDKKAKKLIRSLFPAPEGFKWKEYDYKGVEVTGSACVTGDTPIQTIEGPMPMTEVIDKISKGIYVYGYNFEEKRVCISKVLEGGITRKNTQLIKVTLDNGVSIKCTPDHKFLLRDGEYLEAQNLQEGTSLMPLYISKVKSPHKTIYKNVYLNNGKKIREHNLIALDIFGVDINKENVVVHHSDHNGCNNSLDNIEIMDRKKYMKIHAKEGWENGSHENLPQRDHSKFNQAGVEYMKNLSPEGIEEHKQRTREGLRRSGGNKGGYNGMYGKTHSEETKRRISESRKGKGLSAKPKPPLKMIKTSEGWRHSPESIKKMKGQEFSEETRKKLSENKKEYWKNKEKEVCTICGESFTKVTNTHLKKHGISLEEYSKTKNHKVQKIEWLEEKEDVYNITVEGCHNYAVADGVILKNCYHKDPQMITYLTDKSTDMHRDTCMDLFFRSLKDFTPEERQGAKNGYVFPTFYGAAPSSMGPNLWEDMLPETRAHVEKNGKVKYWCREDRCMKTVRGIKTLKHWMEHVKKVDKIFWGERFKVYAQWKEEEWERLQEDGYVDLYTGFRCWGPLPFTSATNRRIQGSSFHVLLQGLIWAIEEMEERGMESWIGGQIHDAEICLVKEDEEELMDEIVKRNSITRIMEEWKWVSIPLVVDAEGSQVNETWADMEEIGKL